jgi:hypothetical protein
MVHSTYIKETWSPEGLNVKTCSSESLNENLVS